MSKGHENDKGAVRAKRHKFFFIKPIPNNDARSLSERLLGIEGIEEADVREGDYGFIVKAKYSGKDGNIGKYIAESMKSKYGVALDYYNLRKGKDREIRQKVEQ